MSSNAPHLKLGQDAEALACTYLQNQGLSVLTRNFRCQLGEIDLIMRDKQALVFVEVRSRANSDAYHPLASIGYHKQQRLRRASLVFLQKQPQFSHSPCRFDVIGITYRQELPRIEWVKHAWS